MKIQLSVYRIIEYFIIYYSKAHFQFQKRKQLKVEHRQYGFCKFLMAVLFTFRLLQVDGQNQRNLNDINLDNASNLTDKRKLFYINLSSGFSQKAIIHKTSGAYQIKSTSQPFWELGFFLQKKINKKHSLITGLKGLATGRNAIFDVPIKEINPYAYSDPFPPLKNNEFDFIISIPLLLEKDWRFTKNKNGFIQAGLNLQFSLGYDTDSYGNVLTDTNQQRIEVFSLELNSNNHKKPWIIYTIGGGCGWTLKNHNIFKAGLIANISFTKFVNGTYQINIPGHPVTEGTYGITGSYIGMTLSYVFTNANRHFIKDY